MKKLILIVFLLIFAANIHAAEEWQIAKSTHFVVYYRSGAESFVNKVIDRSEELYNRITDDLGFRRVNFWLWEDRATIYIYKNAQDFQAATKAAAWAGGNVLISRKIINTYHGSDDFMDSVFPHEVSHIIFREFVGFNNPQVPLWLDEGVAGYQEAGRRFSAKRIVKSAIINNRLIHLEDLHLFNPDTTQDAQMVDIFYAQSTAVVDYLISAFGKDAFNNFCRALRDKKTLNEAFRYAYNFKDLRQLDEAFCDYIKK